MPVRQTEDVPDVEITDHKISRIPEPFRSLPRHDDVPYTGAAVVYYPPGAAPERQMPLPQLPPRDYTEKGQTLLRAGNVKGAVEELRAAVNERPEIADIRVNFAAALIAARQYQAARGQLEEAIRTGPSVETARAVWQRARARGATTAAAEAERQSSLKTQMLSAHSNLGVVLGLLGRREESIEEFRRALECDPTSEVAQRNLRLARSRM